MCDNLTNTNKNIYSENKSTKRKIIINKYKNKVKISLKLY